MAETTGIEWCHHTFNPWRGCTKISPGCANCYAETLSGRNPKTLGVWGPNGTRVVAAESYWREPVKWNKAAAKAGERRRVFCASLADVFEDWPGVMAGANGAAVHVCSECGAWRAMDRMCHGPNAHMPVTMATARERLFQLISDTPNLDWLLLTKRPENVLSMTYDRWCKPVPGHVSQNEGDGRRWRWPANVWLGTSVEDQQRADSRIPHLLRCPAAVRFLSCEPLLGPVDVSRWLNIRWQCSGCRGLFAGGYQKACPECGKLEYWSGSHPFNGRHRPANPVFPPQSGSGIDWCIVGGESGSRARPMHLEWVRSLVRQCNAADVPVFVKQLGPAPQDWYVAPGVTAQHDGPPMPGERLRDRKGGDMVEWPEDLRVRQFPAPEARP
jgi:protein gp37